jgi:membrane peptidoglycan carboxypeptidase
MYVKDQIVRKYGERALLEGGLNIQTTLDINLQEMAQKEIIDGVNRQKYLNVGNGAAIIENPKTGEILSMVGGADFFATGSGNVNIATALRSPGSSIKVVNYATAFQKGFNPASVIDDSPVAYQTAGLPPYSPRNYDGKFHGRVTIRTALANSYNIPAVKVLNKVGVKEMIEQGKKMGITTWNDESRFGLSLTLGGGEVTMLDLTSVYGVLANGGIGHNPVTILKITDYRGKVFEEFTSPNPRPALPSEIAYLLASILSDRYARAKTFGINSPLNIEGHTVAAKTGTTDTTRDNWTVGFTPSVVTAVWVGNNDGKPMSPYLESGNTGAAPIWHNIMAAILKDKPDEKWELPEKVIPVQVCSINGLLPCENCPTVTEYFVKGSEPVTHCKIEPTPTPTQITVYSSPPPENPPTSKKPKTKKDIPREFSLEVKGLTQAQD